MSLVGAANSGAIDGTRRFDTEAPNQATVEDIGLASVG
jgi:hypothetical protein